VVDRKLMAVRLPLRRVKEAVVKLKAASVKVTSNWKAVWPGWRGCRSAIVHTSGGVVSTITVAERMMLQPASGEMVTEISIGPSDWQVTTAWLSVVALDGVREVLRAVGRREKSVAEVPGGEDILHVRGVQTKMAELMEACVMDKKTGNVMLE
jgi:hypothetical protein